MGMLAGVTELVPPAELERRGAIRVKEIRAESEVAEKAAQGQGRGIWPSWVSSLPLSLCVSVSLNKSCKPYSI